MSHRELDDMLGKGWRKPAFVKKHIAPLVIVRGLFRLPDRGLHDD